MPALFVFLLKVNAALLLFCAGYYFVLRHLTFYTLNRVYLVLAIVFASAYPKINLSGFAERHQQIVEPVQQVVFKWQRPAAEMIRPLTRPDYWHWVEIAFWVGALLLAIRMLMQLFSLYKLYRASTAADLYSHRVRLMNSDSGPFSFWKSIYINPSRHEPAELRSILMHEQVHVNELHTLDILLAEFSTIFYWFNPGVWLIKKAVRENIEFITDRKILNSGIDTRQYQYSLVNVGFSAAPQGIVNHFNVSTIKKRIIMMNAKRSSKLNLTRYAFLIPAVIILLLVFSISKAALVKKHAGVSNPILVSANKINDKLRQQVKLIASTLNIKTTSNTKTNNLQPLAAKFKDTLKNGSISISTSTPTDSLNYVINGVKSTKAGFKALDPDKIYRVDLIDAERSAQILKGLDGNHSTLFVTTSDSDAGKKFKQKIDALNGHGLMLGATLNGGGLTNVNGNTIALSSTNKNYDGNSVSYLTQDDEHGDGSVAIYSRPESYKIRKTVTKDGKVKIDTIRVKVHNYLTYSKSEPYTINFKKSDSLKLNAVILSNIKDSLKTFAFDDRSFNTKSFSARPFKSFSFNNRSNISHLSAKLIMIDGKEATAKDMKRLSVADIESMSSQSGEDVIKKYGDKAKNGVLFISTKKAEK